MEKKFYVYIMSNKRNGTLYTGMTSDIHRRLETHKNKLIKGFTQKYGLTKLVYIEVHDEPGSAIAREKAIKKWNRSWKLKLIEEQNPGWDDLTYML